MINESSTRDIAALAARVSQVEQHLSTLMTLVKGLVVAKGEAPTQADPKMVRALYSMTPKQHITLQMIVAGCSNADIAKQLHISENTAKVHVRTLFSKLDVRTRAQVVAKALPAMAAMNPEDYLEASGGIPFDWAETYRLQDDDPCKLIYL